MDNSFTTVEMNISLGKSCLLEVLLELFEKPQKKKKKLDTIQPSPTSDVYRKVKKLYAAHAQTLFHSRLLLCPRHTCIIFPLMPKQLLLR